MASVGDVAANLDAAHEANNTRSIPGVRKGLRK